MSLFPLHEIVTFISKYLAMQKKYLCFVEHIDENLSSVQRGIAMVGT